MALEKHLYDTRAEPEIPINDEGRVGIKQIWIKPSQFVRLVSARDDVVVQDRQGMIAVEQSCP